jgi:hypothetical protein
MTTNDFKESVIPFLNCLNNDSQIDVLTKELNIININALKLVKLLTEDKKSDFLFAWNKFLNTVSSDRGVGETERQRTAIATSLAESLIRLN